MVQFTFKRFKIITLILWVIMLLMIFLYGDGYGYGYDHRLLLHYKLKPPSRGEEEYQLDNPRTTSAQNGPMLSYIRNILSNNGVEKGFFVECGAHDGEYLSNTLPFEKYLGWSGLLIEPDPVAYSRLLTKKRKSWTTNVCLSTTNSEQIVKFRVNPKNRVLGSVEYIHTGPLSDPQQLEEYSVQCVPLADLLFAIRISTVDYLSLDIEGNELDVLKTIPFDNIFIKVLSVEKIFIPGGSSALNKFMESKNYRLIDPSKYMSKKEIAAIGAFDSVFVHSNLTVKDPYNTNLYYRGNAFSTI